MKAKTAENEWVPVSPIPGAIVVNVGEIFERWTQGYIRATVRAQDPLLHKWQNFGQYL